MILMHLFFATTYEYVVFGARNCEIKDNKESMIGDNII